MEIGLYAESTGLATLDEVLRRGGGLGITRLELATGGQAERPFLDLDALLASEPARRDLLARLADHGFALSALNASAFPLHPRLGADHTALIERTLRLAGLLGVDRVVVQSGVPGDGSGAAMPNWVVYPWPEENREMVRRQWEAVIDLWRGLAATGRAAGVSRLCFEMHPLNLVYNVPTLLHLRDAVGPEIGANFDPSHLIWQGMDIPACVRALGSAVFHVHIKDVAVHRHNLALVGLLDNRPDASYHDRPWTFCTPGFGHDERWWREFVVALRDIGYDDVASIENEDPYLPGFAGVERTVAFLRRVL
ncbi:MAG: sugar phosphate isomerase/epimerase [Chloroflexia bacterium]|nr:sugar phosphate isomerase/epimerase [Chloroflexia bacterium]